MTGEKSNERGKQMLVGKYLKRLLEKNSMTQKELSGLLGVSKQSVSRYVNDQREMDYATIRKIVSIFNVTSDYLLGIDRNDEMMENSAEELTGREFKIPLISHYIGNKPFMTEENIVTYFQLSYSVFGTGNFFVYRLEEDKKTCFSNAICPILLNQYVLVRRQERFFNNDVLALVLEGSKKIRIRRVKIKDDDLHFDLNGLKEDFHFTKEDAGKKFQVVGKVINLVADV